MFERLKLVIGEEAINIINKKTIMIIGLGGVGGAVVESLVRSGVSNIIIVDYDVVEESNLNRQRVATISSIGMKKVDAMEKIVLDLNSKCKILKHDLLVNMDNIKELFIDGIDYVIDAIDDVKAKKLIIRECLDRKIEFVSSMGTGNKIDPTLLEIVDIRKTNNDPLARIFRSWVKKENIKDKIIVLSSKEVPVKSGKIVGSTCFVPNSAGILIASYVVNNIIKK